MTKRQRVGKFRSFGKRLEHWRGEREIEAVVRRVKGMGLPFNAATLRGWEYGWTGQPDPIRLLALAAVYGVSFGDAIGALIESRSENASEAIRIPAPAMDDIALKLADEAGDAVDEFTAVRLLADRIAAGPPIAVDESRTFGHLAFSKRWLDKEHIVRPICITVGRREESMLGTINPGDVVLLDCADARRLRPKHDRIYAANVDGGSTLKRIAVIDHQLMLIADNPDKERYPTRALPLEEDQSLLEVIVGEVMWKGQSV